MDRRAALVGFVAGGALAAMAFGLVPSPFRAAVAGPPADGQPAPDPVTPTTPGRTINPDAPTVARGNPHPAQGTAAWNNRAIALAGTVGSGETVVYYFDTEAQRLLVYGYRGGDRGGLSLLAARHYDMDLKLEAYRDRSEKSRDDLKSDYDKQFGPSAPVGPGGKLGESELPVKKVESPLGK
jgi:hypothetical protein